MRLHFLFSKNKKIGSRLISWASGLLLPDMKVVPSHVAILITFDDVSESFVAESVFESGVRLVPYSSWLVKNEECFKLPCAAKLNTMNEVFDILVEIWDKKYDWLGVTFFAGCFIRHWLFKTPFPKENSWQSDGKYFCTEAAAKLSGYTKHSMTTPAKMCWDLLKE